MPTIKKIFFKKISTVLGLFIVCGFSLTLGAILLRVAFSAFTQPTLPPTDANQELGALADKIGNPGDAAGTDTVFGKVAGIAGGGVTNFAMYVTQTEYDNEIQRLKQMLMDKSGGVVKFTTALYNGNLGGIAGANAKCASEFPGHRFANKAEAVLILGGSFLSSVVRKTDLTGFNYQFWTDVGIKQVGSAIPDFIMAAEARLAWTDDATYNCVGWTSDEFDVGYYGSHIYVQSLRKMDEEFFVAGGTSIGGQGNYAYCAPLMSLACVPI